MSYTLHQLRIFETVASEGSVTGAAKKLHMTQPAVSIQLKQLQDHFGIPLTEIIGRKLYLTDAGKELYSRIRTINAELTIMETRLDEIRGAIRGKLHFSVVSTGKYFMPSILGRYKTLYPGIELQMEVSNRFTTFQHLKDNDTDFAVVSIPPKDLPVESLPIMSNPLVMAAPPGFVNETSGPIPFRSLQDQPFLIREKGSGTRLILLDLIQKNRIEPNIAFELATSEAIKQAVMAGLGISLLSKFSIKSELQSGEIQVLNVENFPLVNTWQVIWRKGRNFSPAARTFLEFLESEKTHFEKNLFGWVYER